MATRITTNYRQPLAVDKRTRFFDGQFLVDQDFVDEQKYHLDRQQRHQQLLHGSGITSGLLVSSDGRNQVTVSSGAAIDSAGRQVVLTAPTTLKSIAAGTQWLHLAYHQVPADAATTEGGIKAETRWQEAPYLFVADRLINENDPYDNHPGWKDYLEGDRPPAPVVLARLVVAADGKVAVDGADRRYAGLRLPGPSQQPAQLRGDAGGAVGLWMLNQQGGELSQFLNVTADGNLGVGTAGPKSRLAVTGGAAIGAGYATGTAPANGLLVEGSVGIGTTDLGGNKLSVAGNTTIGGTLTVSGTTTLQNDLTVEANKATKLGGTLSVTGTSSFSGDLRINDKTILLRSGTDSNHGFGWFGGNKLFATTDLDGPVVYGWSGGALGTTNGGQRLALRWTKDGNVGIGIVDPGTNKLSVVGNTRLDGTLTTTGNATLGGTLGVSGNTTVGGTLGITSNTTIGGTLGVTSNTTVGGTLGVSGNTTVGGTLGITSNTTVGGTLGVTGASSFSEDVRIGDKTIQLRSGSDVNHGLGWFGGNKQFASASLDGPAIYGWTGGALGTTNGGQKIVLYWHKDNKVGIGTTSPGARLDVSGGIKSNGTWIIKDVRIGIYGNSQSSGKIGDSDWERIAGDLNKDAGGKFIYLEILRAYD